MYWIWLSSVLHFDDVLISLLQQTRQAWRIAFYITGAVHVFGTTVFLILGSGNRQKWSIPETKEEDAEAPIPLKEKNDAEVENRKDADEANSK